MRAKGDVVGVVMIYSKANLLVLKVASKDQFDRGLNGVRFEPDGSTVASNGRVVMVVSPADENRAKFPEKVGDQMGPGDEGLVMTLEAVEKTVKGMSKDKRMGLQYIGMMKSKDPARVALTSVDERGNPSTYASLPKREKFPFWRKILRGLRGPIKICVNRKDLIDLLGAMEAACPDKGGVNPIFMEMEPDGRGVLIRCLNHDTQQRAIGGVSRYDTRGQWLSEDEWEQKLFEKKRKAVRRIK